MLKRKHLFTAILALTTLGTPKAMAQTATAPAHFCGTSHMEEQVFMNDAKKRQEYEQYNQQILAAANSMGKPKGINAPRFIIPVVVHIIQPTAAVFVDDAQVYNAISILNRDFQKRNPDTSVVVQRFRSIIGDPEFEFRLATKDPNGNCTNGITRTISSFSTAASDNVKDLISWNTAKYYNIWVVQTIASGAGGYAYRPGNSPGARYEGVVVLASQFGSIGLSCGANLCIRTLTHETGHYFNLNHTWGGSNTPGIASNCGIDDGISDTPNTIGVNGQACPTTQASCAGDPSPVANVENYMDYADCERMFTIGQTNAMIAAANSSRGSRNSLWTPANLSSTGVADPYNPPACRPVAVILNNPLRVCTGSNVSLSGFSTNVSTGTNVTYTWLTPGAAQASYSGQTAVAVFPNAGAYTIKLVATTTAGSDTTELVNGIIATPAAPAIQQVFQEGVEDANFPAVNADTNANWQQSFQNATHRWLRDVNASTGGVASLRLRNRAAPGNNVTTFTSPQIATTGFSQGTRFYYKMAWAPRSAASYTDQLRVQISTDCGSSWTTPKVYSSTSSPALTTVSGSRSAVFIPTATEWRTEFISLASVRTRQAFKVRFEFTSGTNGNDLYLDDLSMGLNAVTSLDENLSQPLTLAVYPNPADAGSVVDFMAPAGQHITLSLTDAVGRVISQQVVVSQADKNNLSLSSLAGRNLSAGIYILKASTGQQDLSYRVVVAD